MHWQEALNKSSFKRAVRRDAEGRVFIRYPDGSCTVTLSGGRVREARPAEYEGFGDWESMEVQGDRKRTEEVETK